MNKYLSLIKNVFIFGLGNFSSKLLVFFLMPFYTRMLTTADYGTADIITNTSNLIIPIVSVSIIDSIIRFGLEKSVKKSDVFTTGILCVLCGFGVFLLFIPLMNMIPMISGYVHLIYMYVLAASLNSVCSQFVRSRGLVKLFAYSGVQSTLFVVLFNVLLLYFFRLGLTGYVLSTILSDVVNSVFLFFVARLHRYLNFKNLDKKIMKSMILFSIPVIPNTIFWWITNVSDRYIVTYMMGADVNGLYSVAYKIPSFISMISAIFMQAWQMSAITEYSEKNRSVFYSRVFYSYQALMFFCGSAIIVFIQLITQILVAPSYFDSWQYVPFLIIAVIFQCFSNFLGSIYMAAKRNQITMVTTLIGAIFNIVVNILLIPYMGANGAAVSTFLSYFIVFFLRVLFLRRIVKVRLFGGMLLLNTFILLVQSVLLIFQVPLWALYEVVLTVLLLLINVRPFIGLIKRLLERRQGQRRG